MLNPLDISGEPEFRCKKRVEKLIDFEHPT